MTDQYKVVPSSSQSELQKFASWFHQDWKIVFPNFRQGAGMYISQLSPDAKASLKSELSVFISDNRNVSPLELRRKWIKLGAQAWQPELDIHLTLKEFHQMIDKIQGRNT